MSILAVIKKIHVKPANIIVRGTAMDANKLAKEKLLHVIYVLLNVVTNQVNALPNYLIASVMILEDVIMDVVINRINVQLKMKIVIPRQRHSRIGNR